MLAGVIPDFLTLRQWFGFRGVELGKWVTQAEQEQAAGWFFDALCDLNQILCGRPLSVSEHMSLAPQLIALRSSLALQYGTGGRPGVSAHYAPAARTFALAKNAGPGSIAHEWFHAFDHHMASKAFHEDDSPSPEDRFASLLWLTERPRSHPLNQLLSNMFACILLDEDGNDASELFQRSAAIDRKLGTRYYSRPEELSARCFEAFVQDASIRNAFLVKGTLQSEEAKLGLYPLEQERARINQAFSAYFQALTTRLLQP